MSIRNYCTRNSSHSDGVQEIFREVRVGFKLLFIIHYSSEAICAAPAILELRGHKLNSFKHCIGTLRFLFSVAIPKKLVYLSVTHNLVVKCDLKIHKTK